ncbi:methyltransferase [Nonlabens sp. YIK11]|uniref:O-methyltransferase n=1 Tax=Nonlabens sp. YIK11 TaxID=1453349 RepID=UPI0006DC3DEE|nr:class I SAM-dependent methyltransferase [Nonlabens sp. YIK11]KQC34156.1 methyltransferase [Nonlabens sp. YIK11]
MLHQLKHYLKHRWKSFHLHGIHSPFVFTLNRDCLQKRSHLAVNEEIVRFRESVKNHPQLLHIEDHGAGSKRLQEDTRKSSEILKHNCSSLKRAQLLSRLTHYLNVQRALELGTSLGIGTHALAMACQQVTSIEASPEVRDYASARLKAARVKNAHLVTGTFQDFLDGTLHQQPSGVYDLVFIDGHHDGAETLRYFEALQPFLNEQSVVVIDDIYWSKGMTRAWEQLIHHPKVTASIDTYQWGILFFRKEQRQQAFHIHV